ncbi:protein MICROTUBULE BINDING PROTEIN 2C [Humulus lupulus]|uniref:protein MICROTUBULE BINDING PROTEIN 2C n=1 Tax=Humulus lupulus TaxID=3486 RepID=UPI002B4025D7|nr:protein MICROTUBULE BINDING PROTEIN 2C [Humulus lupulus]
MYEAQQHFVELQDNASGFRNGDPNSWLSGDPTLSPTHRRNHPSSVAGSNVDRDLFKDLVEIVPLVQSLIDRKANSSFTRRGSMIYTKTPSRVSLSKKVSDLKGRNAAQPIPTRKKRELGEKNGTNNPEAEGFSIFSSKGLTADDREELELLKGQVEDLQRKLLEKDESLKSADDLKNQMSAIYAQLDNLKLQTSEKDSFIKSTQQQLSDAKITLADKQAALEKIQWEAMTSNTKVEKLQEELNSVQGDISSFMLLFEGLLKTDPGHYAEDYDISPCNLDSLPCIDDLDEMEMHKMEEARKAYVAAVAAAKERKDEESIASAARARLHLQGFVFRKSSVGGMQ